MAPRRALARPHKRDGHWCLIRRVPRDHAGLDQRNPVVISTGIPSVMPRRAILATEAVRRLDVELERYWSDKLGATLIPKGGTRGHARRHSNWACLCPPPRSPAFLPISDILHRIESLEARKTIQTPAADPTSRMILSAAPLRQRRRERPFMRKVAANLFFHVRRA